MSFIQPTKVLNSLVKFKLIAEGFKLLKKLLLLLSLGLTQ